MNRQTWFLLVLFVCLGGGISLGLAQNMGVIRGTVHDASKGQPVPDQEVILEQHTEGKEVQPLTTTTNAQGAFTFEGLSTAEDVHYQVRLTYAGHAYHRGEIRLTEAQPQQHIEFVVYSDLTNDPSQIRVLEHQVWLSRVPQVPAAALVREFVRVNNAAEKAYVDESGNGIRLGLPPGYQHAASLDPELATDFVAEGEFMIYRRPLPPGESVLSFSYVILASPQADLSRPLLHDTEMFFLLISDPTLRPQNPRFQQGPLQQVQGQSYQTYGLGGLSKGQIVPALLISGGAKSKAGGFSGQRILLYALVIFGIALMITLGSLFIRRRPTSTAIPEANAPEASPPEFTRDELEQLREARLELIAHLDDMLEAQQIPPKLHQHLRDEQKMRLAALIQRLESQR